MSDIDFQNGLLCGISLRKTVEFEEKEAKTDDGMIIGSCLLTYAEVFTEIIQGEIIVD